MPDTLCRLAIHVHGGQGPSLVDLMLPADCPIGVLIPSMVEIARPHSATVNDPQSWHLTRVGGTRLDSSKTLRENDIRDGELILLTTAALPEPHLRPGDPSGVVAGTADRAPSAALRGAVPAASLSISLISAATLAWSGTTGANSAQVWTAVAVAAATAAGAVGVGRTMRPLSVVLSISAVVFAAVTGVLVVPGSSWAPATLLAASCAFAVSILMLRMACGEPVTLTACAATAGVFAAVGVIAVTAAPPLEAAAALLVVLSLAALSLAPKLTVAVAGLGPSRPEVGNRRAAVAHRVLTGLVVGWSASAMLGVAAVAAVAVRQTDSSILAGLFAADVGLVLLLRQRTHIDARRRIALAATGLCALAAAHIVAVSATPQYAYVLCAATVVAGVAALRGSLSAAAPNPVVRHGVQLLEYLALAAVVPLAAWVSGVYGLVRDVSLS